MTTFRVKRHSDKRRKGHCPKCQAFHGEKCFGGPAGGVHPERLIHNKIHPSQIPGLSTTVRDAVLSKKAKPRETENGAGRSENGAGRSRPVSTQTASPPRGRPTAGKTPPRSTAAVPSTAECRATTKSGKPCPHRSAASGLCHVHDPAVQCGAVKDDASRCATATGGGPCARHNSKGKALHAGQESLIHTIDFS